ALRGASFASRTRPRTKTERTCAPAISPSSSYQPSPHNLTEPHQGVVPCPTKTPQSSGFMPRQQPRRTESITCCWSAFPPPPPPLRRRKADPPPPFPHKKAPRPGKGPTAGATTGGVIGGTL